MSAGGIVAPSTASHLEDWPALPVLERLVSLAAGSYDVAEIQAANDLLAEWYARSGFRVERIPVADRGDVLLAELSTGRAGSPDGRRVTLVGHSDTVWPAASVVDPRLRVDAARSRWAGPGIGDMKAALLMASDAAVAAAGQLTEAPAGLIRILVVPDEEVGSGCSAAVIDHLVAETDLCLGLEAGKPDGAFITSRGAVGAIRIDVAGAAAHVTEPGGVNAVEVLVAVLSRVREIAVEGPQVSITQLAGGTARQIAAGEASCWIDLRAETAEGMAAAVAGVGDAVDVVQRGTTADIRILGGQTRPAFPVEASRLPWQLLTAGDLEEVGAVPAPTAMHERGGSDASTFAAAGVPTIDGFGPVCFDNCGPTESISVDSVVSRTALMAALIAAWSRR